MDVQLENIYSTANVRAARTVKPRKQALFTLGTVPIMLADASPESMVQIANLVPMDGFLTTETRPVKNVPRVQKVLTLKKNVTTAQRVSFLKLPTQIMTLCGRRVAQTVQLDVTHL